MNAVELIEEVSDIIDDPSYSSVVFLRYLNQAELALAGELLLPDLADGFGTVDTDPAAFSVALPADYHKGLFHAQCDGVEIGVLKNLKSLAARFGSLTVEAGDVAAVAVNGKKLLYLKVPAEATAVELFFYRKPVAMTESGESNPDGFVDNDDFDWALIHHACWKIFSKIEQGVEGAKVGSRYHEDQFNDKRDELDVQCYRVGKSTSSPSVNMLH